MREFDQRIHAHVLRRERERMSIPYVCSLSIASSSTSEPQVVNSRKASAASGAQRGKTDDSLSKAVESNAEGSETEDFKLLQLPKCKRIYPKRKIIEIMPEKSQQNG